MKETSGDRDIDGLSEANEEIEIDSDDETDMLGTDDTEMVLEDDCDGAADSEAALDGEFEGEGATSTTNGPDTSQQSGSLTQLRCSLRALSIKHTPS